MRSHWSVFYRLALPNAGPLRGSIAHIGNNELSSDVIMDAALDECVNEFPVRAIGILTLTVHIWTFWQATAT